LRKLNKKRPIKLFGNGLMILTTILILRVYLDIYQTSLTMDNPLIPHDLFYEVNQTKLTGGIILTFGLFLMVVLKSLKQNFTIMIIGILTILFYSLRVNGII
jgi:hypothetical protein